MGLKESADIGAALEKMLFQLLKSNRILMDKLCITETGNTGLQISLNLAYVGKGNYSTGKAAKIFSVVLGKEIVPKESSPLYIMEEFIPFSFVLKP